LFVATERIDLGAMAVPPFRTTRQAGEMQIDSSAAAADRLRLSTFQRQQSFRGVPAKLAMVPGDRDIVTEKRQPLDI
jgi:hypothetical protein